MLSHGSLVPWRNSVERVEHDVLRRQIAKWRSEAGLNQRELSLRLNENYNYIVKIEKGARGVTVIEFLDIITALGLAPADAFKEFAEALVEFSPPSISD